MAASAIELDNAVFFLTILVSPVGLVHTCLPITTKLSADQVLFMDLLEAILLVISFMALFIATGIRHGPQVHFDWIQARR